MKKLLTYCIVALFLFSCGNSTRQKRTKPDNPKVQNGSQETFDKPTINVYMENSGSMAGYVKGNTEFKDAVYNYLTDIKISGITDTLNLFYINSKPIEKGSNIEDFILKLNPNHCVFSTSDIANVFDTVLARTDTNHISVLITDGIFSPGKKKDAIDYLVNQQIGIKRIVADYLKKYSNTAIAVYQLSSNFNGTYYNRNDAKTEINAQRPYYIWVIGNMKNIALLKTHISDEKFKGGGIKHSYTLLPSLNKEIDYAILNSPKFGSFNRDPKTTKTSIYNIKKASNGTHKGTFMFTIGMDLSLFSVLLGNEYLMDTTNYARSINKQPNNDYYIEIERNNNPNTSYTHNMKLTTQNIAFGELEIVLQNKLSQWVNEINDDEGLDINKKGALNKTFGFKYLVEGIYEAYNFSKNTTYTTMKLNLKK